MIATIPASLRLAFSLALLAPAAMSPTSSAQTAAGTVNVYTTRERDLIEPLLKVFEELARVKLNVVYVTTDTVEALTPEVQAGKVDVFIASEFSQLVAAKASGLTQAATKPELTERVPAGYRDAEGHWFGLTRRLRIVAASKERVTQTAFTYEELAEPKWKGRVCVRSGRHPYNVMLVASMIAGKGAAAAETWLRGLKSNLADKPAGGDRDQVGNVHAGKCDIALVNTYYVGALLSNLTNPQQAAWGNAVRIVFPNAGDRGAHVSISGIALAKGAKNVAGALTLMDFMTSEPAQFIYGLDNHEYPIRTDVEPPGLVASWGKPKIDQISLSEIAKHYKPALDLIDKVGLDQGPGS